MEETEKNGSFIDKPASLEQALLAIADFISTERKQKPLEGITAFAASHFNVEYVHIAILEPDQKSVKVVAGWLDGQPIKPGYVYALPGTPCENVVQHDHKCYAEHVQELFPQDYDLVDLEAQAYIGEPINASDGHAAGLIVLVSRRPLQSSNIIAAGMRILASYISSVMSADEVRAERERYRNLMQHASDAIIIHDMDLNVIDFNLKAKEMFGYDDAGMMGLNVTDFDVNMSPEEMATVKHKVMDGPFTFETVHRRKDASTYDAAVTAVKITLDNKPCFYTSIRDISEQKILQATLEKNSNQLTAILQTTRDAFWLVNQNGKLIDVNQAVCDMLGYSREELLEKSIIDIDASMNDDDIASQMALIINQGFARFETLHRHKDGRLINADVSTTFIPSQGFYVAFIRDITEQKCFQTELANQRGFLRTLVNTIPDLVWLKDPEGIYLACNSRFESFFGATEEQIIGLSDYDFVDKQLADSFRMHDKKAMSNNRPTVNQEQITFASDGHQEWLQTTKTPMYAENGELIGVLGIGHDLTEMYQYEDAIRQSEESFRSLFDSLQEAVYVQDENGVFLAVNEGASKMYRYPKEWFVGKTPLDVSAPDKNDLEALAPAHQRALAGEPQTFEFWGLRSDGKVFPKEVHQTKGSWFGKEVVFAVALDITERKKHQEQLEHIAHYDSLTGLPNRLLLADRLHQAMVFSKRHGSILATAYLDLDGFKTVNDMHGHDMGDRLLVHISKRLKKVLREEDTLARLGGDEFVAVLLDLSSKEACIAVLERLVEAASDPVNFDGIVLRVSASIGVTFYSRDDVIDADQLIRQSDQAMYHAKQTGKNRYHIFDAEYDRIIRGRHESLQRISHALTNDEFELYYQPKVNLRSGEVIGAEALIRWQHPEKGLLLPNAFLPVIEHHPVAVEIGDWVIETALKQLQQWRSKGIKITISVNVDGIQLQQHDFVTKLAALMKRYPDIQSGDLELEVLETSALEDIKQISRQINACQEIGVNFALDDFGTGYSSLTYLKQLPAQTLKIDKSFVINMLDDPEDLAILDGVLELASVFGRQTVAEGIETLMHCQVLLRMGSEIAQGYAIAKPMPAVEFETWVKDWQHEPAWSGIKALDRQAKAGLYAIAEHRCWIKQFEGHLSGRFTDEPPLDEKHCGLGNWLNRYIDSHNRSNPGLQELIDRHAEIHEKARALSDDSHAMTSVEKHQQLKVILQLHEELEKTILEVIDDREK